MTRQEFESQLSENNLEFVKEKYITIDKALNAYQKGAMESNVKEYLNVNEYFDIMRVQYICNEFLKNYL